MSAFRLFLTLVVLLGLAACSRPTVPDGDAAAALEHLDSLVAARGDCYARKSAYLTGLRDRLAEAPSERDRYETLLTLARGYRSFRFDSALLYAEEACRVAAALDDAAIRAALMEESYCYLSAGLFLEAEEVIGRIDRRGMTREEQAELHLLEMKKYIDMIDYNRHNEEIAQKYRQSALQEADSALELLPPGGSRRGMTQMHRLLLLRQPQEARKAAEGLLRGDDLTDNERAIVLFHLGSIAHSLGDEDRAIVSLAQSAGYDITTGTHETTSMARLARELYHRGAIDEALRYIDVALEDANFYDARHRKMTIADIRPLIEESHLRDIDRERQRMVAYTLTVTALCLLLAVAIVVIVVQMRRLRKASAEVLDQSRRTTEANARLREANRIKDEYIGSSFYRQGEYIREEEELYRFILKQLRTQDYDAIRKGLKQSEVVRERKDMYADFDRTFTHLFPAFVSDYRSLFPPEEPSPGPAEGSLTPEMRIFALIRLGVTKNEQIANFLNYSVNTINSYKTRAKNRSLVENKDFEAEVMKIGQSR